MTPLEKLLQMESDSTRSSFWSIGRREQCVAQWKVMGIT